MKKKLLSTVLSAAILATMLTGCGGGDSAQTQAPAADTKTDDSASKTDETDEADDTVDNTQADASKPSGNGKVYYLNFKPEQAKDWRNWLLHIPLRLVWRLWCRQRLPVHMSLH